MINKDKLKFTVTLNGMTLKDLANDLGLNYNSFLRNIAESSLRISTVEQIINRLEFKVYTPTEIFFDSVTNEKLRRVC